MYVTEEQRIARFWQRVDRSGGCWEWTGKCDPYDYGVLKWRRTSRYAHAVAYELVYGPIPDGMGVHQRCGNRLCCNPAHLHTRESRAFQHVLTEEYLWREYVERRRTADDIGIEIGTSSATVQNYLTRYGIPTRGHQQRVRNYQEVNSSGFADLTTDWHAYWVGFLAADGYIRANGSDWEAHIRLKATDAHHLEALKDGLQAEAPIQYLPNQGHPAAQIILRSRPLVEALAHWGIVPNKTLTMPWPEHLPAARMPAYIRGYFDGDGTVYQRQRSSHNSTWQETVCRFISGSVLFLDGLERELNRRGICTRKRYRNQGSNAYVLPLSSTRQNLLAFASLIYDGSTVALARKQAVFESLRSQPGKERQ